MLLQLILNGMIAGSIYALIAISFTFIYRTAKFFNFAHGAVYTVGAYIAYSVIIQLNQEFIYAFFLAMAFSALLGGIIDRVVFLPLRRKKASNLVFLLTSFGVFVFIQNLIQVIYGAQILTIRTGSVREGYQLLSAVITSTQIIILITSIVLMFGLWRFMMTTRLGKAMRAVSDDPIAANLVGINSDKTILLSFVIGSALAGAAGVLISLETNIEPTMGFSALLKGIIACIVGGIGSIPGAVLGGFFLGTAENLGIAWIPSGWKNAISFAILIVFLILRPHGILGKKRKEVG